MVLEREERARTDCDRQKLCEKRKEKWKMDDEFLCGCDQQICLATTLRGIYLLFLDVRLVLSKYDDLSLSLKGKQLI
jgi:hypothetical protein